MENQHYGTRAQGWRLQSSPEQPTVEGPALTLLQGRVSEALLRQQAWHHPCRAVLTQSGGVSKMGSGVGAPHPPGRSGPAMSTHNAASTVGSCC